MKRKLDDLWQEMYQEAKKIQGFHQVSAHMEVGGVSAAVLSNSGKIYTGVCVDTACSLGVCAERNALFNMISNGEYTFKRVLAIMPNGKNGAPCGACREFMMQLMEGKSQDIEILLDYEDGKVANLDTLTPDWWI